MKHDTTGDGYIMLAPETVAEAGLMQWIAKRFAGKSVTIEFDTTEYMCIDKHPMMWIRDTELAGGPAPCP